MSIFFINILVTTDSIFIFIYLFFFFGPVTMEFYGPLIATAKDINKEMESGLTLEKAIGNLAAQRNVAELSIKKMLDCYKHEVEIGRLIIGGKDGQSELSLDLDSSESDEEVISTGESKIKCPFCGRISTVNKCLIPGEKNKKRKI